MGITSVVPPLNDGEIESESPLHCALITFLKRVYKVKQNPCNFAPKFTPLRIYRNLSEAVISGLESIFDEGKYADKVIEKILKSNPKWGARDRRFIAETTYDIVRWYRLFNEVSEADPKDYWKLLGTWCLWNELDLPPWDEFEGLDRRRIQEAYEQIKDRKVSESIPDWMDKLGEQELGKKWEKELHSLNEEAKVVLREYIKSQSTGIAASVGR
jgi:hypothetical protein